MIFHNIINFFKYKWQAKLGSLIIAILLYFYVQYTKTITKSFYIKVDSPTLPNNLIFSEELPTFVKVHFYGPQEIINLNQDNFRVLMVNTGPSPGKNKFKLELIPPPPYPIQFQLEPSELEILIDNKRRKALPLIPKYELKSSKMVSYININPSSLIIEGPEKILNRLDRLTLSTINLNEKSNLYYGKVLIQDIPKFTKLVENQPFEIQLEVKYFSEEEFQQKITNLPVGYNIFEETLPINCSNSIGRLEFVNEVKVQITYISRFYLTKRILKAEVYCPVELNSITQQIEPSAFISGLPVIIKNESDIKDFEILKVKPLFVDIEFRLKKQPIINQLEKGLQEHLIR